ncbi:ATP-binding protein [Brevundimonas aurantiaca]|jgi:transitional endoplasmic reticulum ATPase|uniref:ATP-binding protein n=1 Tax=Brevundimonas aurantiaca TaxID=74316 RepID=UPI001D186D3B|nr:ATP-binding protein [Brevundimonas aurantiaca]MCC4294175.1 AAA family ATPase [Brevundimonas aurantiaca]
MVFEYPEVLDGDLMKVVRVDDDGSVFVRYQDDRCATVTGLTTLPKRGDILLMGNGFWRVAPPEAWKENSEVGIVRRVLDDGGLVVETAGFLRTVRATEGINCIKGHAIEFNTVEGVLRILSETPITRLREELEAIDEPTPAKVVPRAGTPKLGFADFGGFGDVVAEARELVESQFRYRKYADQIGVRPLRGVLFTGPSGVGKTHLARIIARETDAEFHLVDGPSLVSKWVGSSERALREVFARAEAAASGRAIIFFDEIDSIAERRTDHSSETSSRMVGQLLTLMDGFRRDSAVIVLAATNRPEALDPAILRAGRFDRHVAFRVPTEYDRREILKVGARPLQTDTDLPFEDIAALTVGWSAADLGLIWTEAGMVAARDERSRISAEDMVVGYERAARRVVIAVPETV